MRTRYARFPSPRILQMRSGRRRSSLRLRCLMARRMLREHHDKGTLALRKFEDFLPENSTRSAIATDAYLAGKTPATTQSSSSLAGLHQSQLGSDCLCLPIGLGRDCLCLSVGKAPATIQSLLLLRLCNKQISRCNRAGRDN